MAAPADMTTLNLSGYFTMNKSLSDDSDVILRLQGVGWFTRKTISIATVHLYYSHYKEAVEGTDTELEHVDVEQKLSGGISGTCECRVFDWVEHPYEDDVFGAVILRTTRLKVNEVPEGIDLSNFLKEGWADDVHEHGAVYTIAINDPEKNKNVWRAEQIWGFKDVNGERRHVRHVDFTGPKGERVLATLIYDYHGPVPSSK